MSTCPNDCSVCRELESDCIYKVPSEVCPLCGNKVFVTDLYVIKTLGIEREMCVDCFSNKEVIYEQK